MDNQSYTHAATRKSNINMLRSLLGLCMALTAVYGLGLRESVGLYETIYALLTVLGIGTLFIMPRSFFKQPANMNPVFVADILLIAAGTYLFSTVSVQFLLCVFLAVFISALKGSVVFSLLTALVADSLYLYFSGFNPGAAGADMQVPLMLNVPFIFVVSVYSSVLAQYTNEEIREKTHVDRINSLLARQVSSKSKELAAVSGFVDELCESFADGILIFDNQGVARICNGAFSAITGLGRNRVVDKPITSLAALNQLKDSVIKLRFSGEETHGAVMKTGPEGSERDIVYNTVQIRDVAGEPAGTLCQLYGRAAEK